MQIQIDIHFGIVSYQYFEAKVYPMRKNLILMQLRKLRPTSGPTRHVATLLTGTVLSQSLSFVLMVPLARIYTPSDYGVLALYQALISLLAAIASLRFDMTIMLPKSEAEARSIKQISTRCVLATSAFATLVALLVASWVGLRINYFLGQWFPTIGMCVFFTAETANLQYWLNRTGKYRMIAVNRLVAAAGASAYQLIFSVIIRGPGGLILGLICGILTGYLAATWNTRELWRRPIRPAPSLKRLAKRYRKMPLLNGPNTLVDAIRINGVNFLIAHIALSNLGQFNPV